MFSLLSRSSLRGAIRAVNIRQLVKKPGFRPKGRAVGTWEKSENFDSLRPILFELCKKQTTGIGLKGL